jgi:transposase InsO family protein
MEERFRGVLLSWRRGELLNLEEFTTLAEGQAMASDWRDHYNHRRPHSSMGIKLRPSSCDNVVRSIILAALGSAGITANT